VGHRGGEGRGDLEIEIVLGEAWSVDVEDGRR